MVLTCPTVSTECVSRNQAFIERKGDLINLAKVFSPQEVALRYQTTPYITVLLLRNCSFSFRSPKFLSFAEKIYNQQMDWRERGGGDALSLGSTANVSHSLGTKEPEDPISDITLYQLHKGKL